MKYINYQLNYLYNDTHVNKQIRNTNLFIFTLNIINLVNEMVKTDDKG